MCVCVCRYLFRVYLVEKRVDVCMCVCVCRYLFRVHLAEEKEKQREQLRKRADQMSSPGQAEKQITWEEGTDEKQITWGKE